MSYSLVYISVMTMFATDLKKAIGVDLIRTLIAMHNLHLISNSIERKAVTFLLFSKEKHLLAGKDIAELQFKIMRLHMLRKIEKLKGNQYLEQKLCQMIAKVKSQAQDDVSWQQIGEVVKLIETLSYQVLRIVNSPTTGYRQTNDIIDASYQLGATKLEQLLKTIRFSKLVPKEFPAYGTERDGFWEHSIITGLFVQKIARDKSIRIRYYDEKSDKEQAEDDFYFLGLLHDFGMVILDQIFTYFYRELILHKGKGYFSEYANEKKYPFDHTKTGAWALKEADFPLQFARAILYHHTPRQAEDDIKGLCAILYLAECLLDSGLQSEEKQETAEDLEWAADYIGIDLASAKQILDSLKDGVSRKAR